MTSVRGGPGELLQRHGLVISRVLQRQFPSLAEDVIDELVVEAIARVWKRLESSPEKVVPEKTLFPLILTAARRRAIDCLRYSPQIVFASPKTLEQAAADRDIEQENSSARLLTDLQTAIANLEPLDRRIVESAMTPPLSGDWARELASELLQEESQHRDRGKVESSCQDAERSNLDPRELSKLSGKLRVRKVRAIEKLRKSMRANGYHIPDTKIGEADR